MSWNNNAPNRLKINAKYMTRNNFRQFLQELLSLTRKGAKKPYHELAQDARCVWHPASELNALLVVAV